MKVQQVTGDLLDQETEGIVNSWNRNMIPWYLLWPHGVSGAIKKRGGYAPFRELRKKGWIPLGGAVSTGAGRLPFKAIIHVAGLNWYWVAREKSIRDSVRNAVALAKTLNLASLAFPLIGAGVGGIKPARVKEFMLDTFGQIETKIEIVLVEFQKKK